MVTHVPTVDEIAAKLGVENPANTPLTAGLRADPTYLSFLRGAGFSYDQAVHTAFQQETAARTNYATQAQRLPEQLAQAQEATDTGLMDRGAFNSGERLRRETQNVTANQEQGQDLASARAAAIAQAQAGLQGSISDLARQRADAEGTLQDRLTQQHNQDRLFDLQASNQKQYLAAAGAQAGGSGGGGSFTLPPLPTLPSATAPAAAPKAAAGSGPGEQISGRGSFASTPASTAPAQPAMVPGQHIEDYLLRPDVRGYVSGLSVPDQGKFLAFVQASNPTANYAPFLTWLGGVQQQQSAQMALRSGGTFAGRS